MSKCLYNQKGVAHLLLLIAAVGLIAFLAFSSTFDFKDKLFSSLFQKPASRAQNQEDLDRYGYIVELKDEPVVAQKKGVEERKEKFSVDDYKQQLQSKREEAKKDVFQRIGKSSKRKSGRVLNEFENTFNGFALDIDKDQAEEVKKSPFVKNVYPNLEVKALLNESVPLIGADKVWQQVKDAQGRAVTGQGVNIAIIDTGIDTTSPDLGSTHIIERNFEKLQQIDGAINDNDRISVWNNKLVYSNGNVIYIYSFDTKTTEQVVLSEQDMQVLRLSFNQDIIVYYGLSPISNAWFYYDLKTKTHKKISDTHDVGNGYQTNGKIVYSKSFSDGVTNYIKIFLYDIALGTEQAISDDSRYMLHPKVSGDLVAYLLDTLSSNSLKLYNIRSGQTQTFISHGYIEDFKDNRLLMGVGGRSYDLCDLSNGFDENQCQFLDLTAPSKNPSQLPVKTEIKSNYAYVYGVIWEGSIQGDLIFMSANWEGNTIVTYDTKLNRYVQINLLKNAFSMAGSGNKICFPSLDGYIYCHDYDSFYNYPIPQTIFNQKVVDGYDFVNALYYRGYNFPLDKQGHGTHVASIVAGNGLVKGVAPGAKLIAYRVLDYTGYGSFGNVIAALDRAIQTRLDTDKTNDIDIISMSLGATCGGSYRSTCGPDDPQSKAVDNAVVAGITVVVAAGNSGPNTSTISSPGTARKAITVGAVDKSKQIASFSSRGPVNYSGEIINKPDLVAPGVSICAAKYPYGSFTGSCIDDKHVAISGTSMAAPHVAGVAALIKQAHPDWTPQQIKDAIKNNADNLGLDINTQGSGLVNALKIFPSPIPTPTPIPFQVNSVSASVTSTSSVCPKTYTFTGSITTNGPGTVTYTWLRSDNATSSNKTITFSQAGTQTVSDTWTLSASPFTGWEQLKIISPNSLLSNQAAFTNKCSQSVFVTSQTFSGNLGGRTGADAKCQVAADAKGLGGKFRAWVSDNTGAVSTDATFTKSSQPYKRMDGAQIVSSFANFVRGLEVPINIDEKGVVYSTSQKVWTGTKDDGSLYATNANCSNWTSILSADKGRVGLTNETGSNWTDKSTDTCDNSYRLYCFEQ